MSSNESNSHVFEREVELLGRAKIISEDNSVSPDDLKSEYSKLTRSYEQLLEETRLITRVSDRLQNKVNRANEKLSQQADEITKINTDLERNNKVLKNALGQLTKAKISSRAATIALVFAFFLFVISEAMIEPYIESKVDNEMGLLLKCVIFAMFKPIEMLVERFLERKSTGKDKYNVEELLG